MPVGWAGVSWRMGRCCLCGGGGEGGSRGRKGREGNPPERGVHESALRVLFRERHMDHHGSRARVCKLTRVWHVCLEKACEPPCEARGWGREPERPRGWPSEPRGLQPLETGRPPPPSLFPLLPLSLSLCLGFLLSPRASPQPPALTHSYFKGEYGPRIPPPSPRSAPSPSLPPRPQGTGRQECPWASAAPHTSLSSSSCSSCPS